MIINASKSEMKKHLLEEIQRVEKHLESMKDKKGKVNASVAKQALGKIKSDLSVWEVE